jgi:hypothetical protein
VTAVTTPQQGDGVTPVLRGRVPADLKSAALQALGNPDATDTMLIRAGLAALAGLPIEQHAAHLPKYRRRPASTEKAA